MPKSVAKKYLGQALRHSNWAKLNKKWSNSRDS
jgi:hypothetical protein